MNIKVYRYIYITVLALFLCVVFFFAGTLFTYLTDRNMEELIIYFLCYIILIFIFIFQGFMVIRSFSHGTSVLNGVMFNKNKTICKGYFIASWIVLALSLLSTIYLCIIVFSGNKNLFMGDFTMYLKELLLGVSMMFLESSSFALLYVVFYKYDVAFL